MSKTTQKLKNLTTAQALDLLASLGKGNGEPVEKGGGGLSPADLAELQPDGKTGRLVDKLEQRVFFILVREVKVALLQALPGAIRSLGGLSEAPASSREALARVLLNGILEPVGPKSHEPLLRQQAYDQIKAEMDKELPIPKLMEEKREAAVALFALAKELGVFDLAKAYKEESEGENMESRIRAREAELGMDGFSEDE